VPVSVVVARGAGRGERMRVFDIGGKDGPTVVTDRVLTVPNLLSLARLAALPVVYLDLVAGRHLRALVILAVIASTDWLDGYLARRLDQVSRLGILLDPISDRVMFVVVGAGFVVGDLLPLWAVLAVVVRDLAVLVVGGLLLMRGASPPPVTRLGKSSTFALMFALPAFLLASVVGDGPAAPQRGVWLAAATLFAIGVVLHWVSAVGYARSVLAAIPDEEG
jgi:cardiolipin synthase (CMP-forming)